MSLFTPPAQQNTARAKPAATAATPFSAASARKLTGAATNYSNLAFSAAVADKIPSDGWLEGTVFTIAATGGAGTVAVASADAPWNALKTFTVSDASGNPIINLDGYAAYLMQLYQASFLGRADIDTSAFSAVAATGDFQFQLFAMQTFGRDLRGALPNSNAAAAYQYSLLFNSESNIYSTNPTTAPTFSSTIEAIIRAAPPATDAFGNPNITEPPGNGALQQFWSSQIANVVSGANTISLVRVGNTIRNHILVFRDSGGSRANADSTGVTPSAITFMINSAARYNNISTITLRNLAYRQTQIQQPAGVIPLLYTDDPNGAALHEYGDSYIETNSASLLQLQFTSSAAGTVQIITNDIVSNGGSALRADGATL